ncbi:MAG: helix-turn-helix domain-containing protein [Solirubrobacterales bacterium]
METGIGERLRDARRAQGLDLEQVHARTRISPRFLQAMEEEQWEVLPGAAYARAFLHTYAELLGLDADAIVAEYRGRPGTQEAQPEAEPVPQLPTPERRALRPRAGGALRSRAGRATLAALALVALLVVVVALLPLGGSDDERGAPEREAESKPDRDADATPPAAERPSRAELSLTTTGTVWVCLVDERGTALVEGVTLPPGEEQGPFRGDGFELALGNGQVELEANGSPVAIDAAAEPQGFRVTPEGADDLAPAQRPTCG